MKTPLQFFRILVLSALFGIVLNIYGFAQIPRGESVVCRRESVNGFEDITQRSAGFLGSPTTDPQNIRLYISYKSGAWYVGSNYQSGPGFHPTKIVANIDFDLDLILRYIISADGSLSGLTSKLKPFVSVKIEEAFTSSHFYSAGSFDGFKAVYKESYINPNGEIPVISLPEISSAEQEYINSNLAKFKKLGYNSDTYINMLTPFERKDLLASTVKKFEQHNALPETANLNSPITKKKFEHRYSQYLEEKNKKDKIIVDYFTKYDIGIKGSNADALIKSYVAATETGETSDWLALRSLIKKDFDDNLYYLYDKDSKKYVSYIKSQKIKRLLYKKTRYSLSNIEDLEQSLFLQKIDLKKFFILNFLARTEDNSTFKTLDKLFPGNYADFSLSNLIDLKTRIQTEGIKFLICFGHYSNGKIYATSDAEIGYDVDVICNIAKTMGVQVFLLGCRSSLSSGGKTGTLVNVNSIAILNKLFEALSVSKSLADFVGALAAAETSTFGFAFEFEETTGLVKSNQIKTDLIKIMVFDNSEGKNWYDSAIPIWVPKNYFPLIIPNNSDNKQESQDQ